MTTTELFCALLAVNAFWLTLLTWHIDSLAERIIKQLDSKK